MRNQRMVNNASNVVAVSTAGKFAGLVMREVARRGAAVRGLVKNKNQVDAVRQRGVAEVTVGDLGNQTSVCIALAGAGSVFYMSPRFL
jgi:uncharacterized protein YbjT (DUF2867 family)